MRRDCEWCDKQFEARPSLRLFCGSRCRYAARDRKRHVERGTRCEATCKGCGAGFFYESTTRPRLYCLSEPGPASSGGRVVVGWCGSDRSAGARAYLGARPGGRRRDGRWVDPRGTTPAARSLVDRRPWAGVATLAGAGRKTACHLGMVGLAEQIGRGSGDGLEGVGAELAQGVEAAPRELARDRQRRPGVREPARLEREVVGAVGAAGPAGRLG